VIIIIEYNYYLRNICNQHKISSGDHFNNLLGQLSNLFDVVKVHNTYFLLFKNLLPFASIVLKKL